MKLAITCGGTGGHFYPGLSVARVLQERGGQVLLLLSGVHSARQKELAEMHGIAAAVLPLMPSPSPKHPGTVWRFGTGLAGGFHEARKLLRKFQPDALLGMGSFASLPAILAARSRGIPVFLHDGNARIGKANRFLSAQSQLLATAFPPVNAERCRCRVTALGMPLRPELERRAGIGREEAFAELEREFGAGLNPELPTFLVTGGSQGASIFNRVLPETLKQLGRSDFQVLHLSGPGKLDEAKGSYEGSEFRLLLLPGSEKMELFFGAADLVISRSGGSTVAELARFGRPSILIPYPYAAENHQFDNAGFLSDAGAAVRLENSECTPGRLAELFGGFFADREMWRRRGEAAAKCAMPDAAARLLEEIEK